MEQQMEQQSDKIKGKGKGGQGMISKHTHKHLVTQPPACIQVRIGGMTL